jgi:hypothetical protein
MLRTSILGVNTTNTRSGYGYNHGYNHDAMTFVVSPVDSLLLRAQIVVY